jgi:hypothetical protein
MHGSAAWLFEVLDARKAWVCALSCLGGVQRTKRMDTWVKLPASHTATHLPQYQLPNTDAVADQTSSSTKPILTSC